MKSKKTISLFSAHSISLFSLFLFCAAAMAAADATRLFPETKHPAQLRANRVKTFNLSTPEGHRLEANGELTLLDYKGAGQIVRLHISIGREVDPDDVMLKMYWDGEEEPSVMVPVPFFFLDPFPANSIPFATKYFGNHGKHWYCYLPMPFKEGARIVVENKGPVDDKIVAYDVSVEEWDDCPPDLGRFHAQFRSEKPTKPGKAYTALDIDGQGHYIGSCLAVQAREKTLSFLEGLTRIYVDGEKDPTLKVWGTEDFFGGSYYFAQGPYAGPYSGATVANIKDGRFSGYRLLIPDAIPFSKGIKVLISHGDYFGGGPIFSYSGQANYSSVAYWYETANKQEEKL